MNQTQKLHKLCRICQPMPPILLRLEHHPQLLPSCHLSSFSLPLLQHKNMLFPLRAEKGSAPSSIHSSLNEATVQTRQRSAQHRSVYLFAWDSDAAPHLVFHTLLWWGNPGTTRLAEHLFAELHRCRSHSALPDRCRSYERTPPCLHECASVTKLCPWSSCDMHIQSHCYIKSKWTWGKEALCSLRSSWASRHCTGGADRSRFGGKRSKRGRNERQRNVCLSL